MGKRGKSGRRALGGAGFREESNRMVRTVAMVFFLMYTSAPIWAAEVEPFNRG